MGQESCRPAWPKPSGGYQTVTGRRYGRRHAYISFRPALESPLRTSAHQEKESEGLELDSVQIEKDLISKGSHDSSLSSLGSVVSADLKEDRRTLDVNDCLPVFTEAKKNAISPFPMSEHVLRCQALNNSTDCRKSRRTFVKHASVDHPHHSPKNAISFVNIDSFEPDSSEGEECVGLGDEYVNLETEKQRKSLNLMLPECYNKPYSDMSDPYSLNNECPKDSLSQVKSTSLAKYTSIDMCTTPWSLSSSVSEDNATAVNHVNLCDGQQKQEDPQSAVKSSIKDCNEMSTDSNKSDLPNEPVVRPKIRKQVPASSSKKNQLSEENSARKEAKISRKGNRETYVKVEKNSKDEKTPHNKESNTTNVDGAWKKGDKDLVTLQEEKPLVDDTFWDDFEFYGMKLPDCPKDDDSSYCSDGEWSTCLPSYFSRDKDRSSSEESWETLPGKEEQEVQSNSSSLEDENSEFCFQVEEQNSLEEGEIPWLQYREDIESSTDEENEIGPHYLPPGFFILDGNNNLEDDSSMSEDLEVEWRLLDDFGDGIGVAQAMSYMDSQFLTYMALEERLAQAMETALAHLESLAVDVEQAHPPATKESIECLPQIIVTDDHNIVGQEQCCAICCSEYIKDEILTELPCHHLFHKPCVILWLQKSGTCPVCRHILTSLLPEAAAATSFLTDHDSPPSIHNAAGTR
ncbi:E3 ubiquitin-protein ligase Praja-2 isoform X2 [Hyla sarda]|uniref:E3 ubiquitin-protein ligase Praja-2 isoform X2 n=1 Tax=Hyla sarda TaxID=327740 RepID=UPI0024C3D317|nr:E3 ubiquitin-protein ligase Praja-2 isoform X2 [Hyla sarda]